jgi:photosystem II stability/assembly factor-like uncharacterized protein
MNKKYLIGGIVAVVLILGFFILNQKNSASPNTTNESSKPNQLSPVSSITHGHGLAVDIEDPSKVYIATHHGLLVLMNDKDLFKVGSASDDYMGFSPHPTNSKIFFSSGHPSTGGNIGFQKSEDSGFSWKKVSNGINGPVDFHAMTVSAANPNLIFGWFQGALQRSLDEGKNWEIASTTTFPVVNLAADPKDENILYASSPQGLFISKDKGVTWNSMFDGFVSTTVINPQDSQKLLSFSEKQDGLVKSNDGGQNWEKTNANFSDETPLFISFDKQNIDTVYLLTEKNSIFKSTDGAFTWNKIH